MKVSCISCGHELNLGHWVFEDYEGPVKCFSCSKMMEVKAVFENKRNSISIEARD